MTLRSFVQELIKPESKVRVFFVTAKDIENSIFLCIIRRWLETISPRSVTSINLDETDAANLQLKLSMSFLGEQTLFVLSGFASQKSAQQKKLFSVLQSYAGPHTVICPCEKQDHSTVNCCIFDLDSSPSTEDLKILHQVFFCKRLDEKTPTTFPLHEHVTKNKIPLTIESSCMLLAYQSILGKNTPLFIEKWFNHIFTPKQSLFLLSSFFWAREHSQFLGCWQENKFNFPIEFWTSYWLEQVWQAYVFVARKGATNKPFGLPFSFVRRDWSRYTEKELQEKYAQIYLFDVQLKQGLVHESAFDFIVLSHFS